MPPNTPARAQSPTSTWKLEDARARLSEVARRARCEGPRRVMVRGKDAVMVISAFARMTRAGEDIEKRRAIGLEGHESWYLKNMVVSRAYRSKGIGARLLGRQIAQVVDPSGFPASLSTQKLENVSFYRRLGFEVADEAWIAEPPRGFQNWIMVHR